MSAIQRMAAWALGAPAELRQHSPKATQRSAVKAYREAGRRYDRERIR